MKEKVTLNVKEQKRLLVLNEILAGRLTGRVREVVGSSPTAPTSYAIRASRLM